MNAALPLFGAASDAARRFVLRGALAAPCVFARPQVGSVATVPGANGTWSESLANVARFGGAGQRLLIEGQRTNLIRNPRAEGAVSGTPGTVPTYWSLADTATRIRRVVGTGRQDGIDFIDVEWTFSAGVSAASLFTVDSPAGVAGTLYTASCFLAVVAGVAPQFRWIWQDGVSTTNRPLFSLSPTLARYDNVYTTAAAATLARATLGTEGSAGGTTFTLRVGWPQIEVGAFASTPILPSVGTPVAATRGADLATASLAGLGIGANGAGTFFWSGTMRQPAPAGLDQTILQVDGGASTDTFSLVNLAGGTQVALRRVLAGVATQVTLGSVAAGTDFRLGMALDGTGRAVAALNDGTALEVTGGPVGGLTTLRIGSDATGDRALFGETAAVATHGFALPASALPRAVTALPI